ncbi:hypothetical protein [uncultured Fibrobacter sp.]|uniref:hypothetical protein n=1 Tax=uncultured Fibrobacter sp. TaxID=261512 RepID=UPI002805D786|nr:hypothetical protein [uncultured Fibrobacter sp.]
MKIFTWKKAAASAALLSLFACGDDSSSGSKTDVFSTKDDLPECTEKITGDTLYVESDSADYFCEDGEWVIVGDTTATDSSDVSSSSGNLSSSSADSIAADTLSSSSVADSLSSSSSAIASSSSEAASSSSALPIEMLKTCSDSITTISLYAIGDSLVLNVPWQLQWSAYTNADKRLASYSECLVSASRVMDSAYVCTNGWMQCTAYQYGFHVDAKCDSSLALSPWGIYEYKGLKTDLSVAYMSGLMDSQLCTYSNSIVYGCLADNLTRAELTFVNGKKWYFDIKSTKWYSDSDSLTAFNSAVLAIQTAIDNGDFTKVQSLTGLKASDPYMEFFKKGGKVSSSSNGDVRFSIEGFENRSFIEPLIQADCEDINKHWLSKIPLTLTPAVSSSSAKSSSSSAKSSSSVSSSSAQSSSSVSSSSVASSSSAKSSSSAESSSSESSSSSAPTVFNDENLDFLAALATFTKDEGASSADTAVWTAQKSFLSSQGTKLGAFANSLSSGLSDAGYNTLVSESTTTQTYELLKGGSTYLVIIEMSVDTKQTIINITAKKIEG